MSARVVVLVCGGRGYPDRAFVFRQLDWLAQRYEAEGLHVIEGGAEGADRWAREWRQERRIGGRTFAAEWVRLGRKAGMLRNQRMLREGRPALVVAFPGGKGTADMIRRAEAAGVPVLRLAATPTA